MTPRVFTAGWLVSAALLSSWAVSSASDQPPVVRGGQARVPAPMLPALSLEVEAEIGRLAARTAAAVAPAPVRRDPFTFATARRPRRAAMAPAAAVPESAVMAEPAAAPAAPPQPWLAGVADLGAGALTAVVSLRDRLHYVTKGDVIDGRYRIDGVSVAGADVFDLLLGTTLRLSLQL